MRLFQLFRIQGVANVITYDAGLKSTEAEKKSLKNIYLQMDAQAATDDNNVLGYHERAKVFELPEKMIPTQLHTDTALKSPFGAHLMIPVELDIPAGETFKAAIQCAATATILRGVYEYEIMS
jgi:hypothetical protein